MPSVVHLDEVGSTNDWVADAAREGAGDGLWVRADRQRSGRGRRGRPWTSQTGNLLISTLVRSQPSEGPPAQLSFVMALALHDAASTWTEPRRLALKWPNDLMLDDTKCAGILVEGRDGIVIIGCGVNLASHPADTERPATSFPAAGIAPPEAGEAAERLVDAFARRRAEWRSEGFAATRTAWLSRAYNMGGRMEARLGTATYSGIFEGLAPEGALLLREDDGTLRSVHAGEVFGLSV
ncbi:biotin--[acetyl-CoA-carboxylase] ligase [Pacificimonas flava]|uniref:biotin--[biotin carboxyl-carrier protein] ligase n=1 Tax=Pacificimonas flava TaxID=1234595 RepID=M2TR69_9SPHN|nr:biotin--[acetyl-CoA-carboxylase] ligase [Pacificimonas flava]EMD84281.1 Biotin-protein ligase [Pacificimonas flava]MBB5279843.1 BirA family biotin operon repressor/biotin-[acetyl-CoA-carboxylase] ligase [Pacificimonas flava]